MRIYFDHCSLQRPLDDQTQSRIESETEAIVAISSFCETGVLMLIASETLLFEINESSDLERRETTLGILSIARESVVLNAIIEKRAQEFEKFGIKPMDSLHLASAEAG